MQQTIPYVLIRDVWLQNREFKIYNGEPPQPGLRRFIGRVLTCWGKLNPVILFDNKPLLNFLAIAALAGGGCCDSTSPTQETGDQGYSIYRHSMDGAPSSLDPPRHPIFTQISLR